MPSRRAVLGTIGTAAVVGLAGCESLPGDDGVRLYEIRVESVDDQPHTFHTTVEYDGELVHWSSTELAAAETAGEDGTDPVRGTSEVLERTWPDDPGRFVVRVRLDDRPSWRSLDTSTVDATCIDVKADVTDWDGDDDPHLELIPQATDCGSDA